MLLDRIEINLEYLTSYNNKINTLQSNRVYCMRVSQVITTTNLVQ